MKVQYNKGNELSRRKFVVKSELNGAYKSVTFRTCTTYRTQDYSETSRIDGMKQPRSTEETSSIKIYIRDQDHHINVAAESGITFKPFVGSL